MIHLLPGTASLIEIGFPQLFCEDVFVSILIRYDDESEQKYNTVPLKCKLPPLVSFLARRVSFLARQFSFPARRVSFLARFSFLSRITEAFSMEYITRKKSLPK